MDAPFPSSPHPSAIDLAIARTASEWVARRDRGLTAEETSAFEAWQRADPRHAAELARLNAAWRGLDALGGSPEFDAMADAVIARARARRSRARSWKTALAFGGLAAAVVLGVFVVRRSRADRSLLDTPPDNYRVLASTMHRQFLSDGSIAELNGASRIEIDFTAAERRVRLIDGEAHFIVAHDVGRPFFVTAGSVTVRAVGTAFNVRLAADAVEVLVTQGKVKLQDAALAAAELPPGKFASAPAAAADADPNPDGAALVAGQRAVVARGASVAASSAVTIGPIAPAEIDAALGWQSTRLVFNNTPLEDVVAGFNRYNTHRLTIGDPAIRNRTLTGVFRADNREGFVRLLKHSIDVKAEVRTPDETVLLPSR